MCTFRFDGGGRWRDAQTKSFEAKLYSGAKGLNMIGYSWILKSTIVIAFGCTDDI